MFTKLHDFLEWEPPAVQEIISNGILQRGGKMIIAGSESTFKTMFGIQIALCVSQGLPLLGFTTSKTSVAMIQCELPKYAFQHRLKKIVASGNGYHTADIMIANEYDLKLNKPTCAAQLLHELKRIKPGLIIIDPLYLVLGADISNWGEMMKLIDNINSINYQLDSAVIIIHHRRKNLVISGQAVDFGTDEVIGASALKDWANTIIRISRTPTPDVMTIEFQKTTLAERILPPLTVKFNRSTLMFELVEPSSNMLEEDV